MGLFVVIFLLSSVATAQVAPASANAKQKSSQQKQSEQTTGDLPPLPHGRSTVIGGTIASVDPISDRLTLKVFGGGAPMKILFDERTQVYRDGTKTSLQDLRANDRASVETMLDGTTVFARSIHMLSSAPQGEAQGQVVSYDAQTRELTLTESLSRESIKLHVPQGIPIRHQGQAGTGDADPASAFVQGTLLSAKFAADNKGEGIASQIAVLAVPGSRSVIRGKLTFLDLSSNQLAVLDAGSNQSYRMSFDPALMPVARGLHEGGNVKVTAEFQGTRYIATEIAPQ